jgi:membrane associated rhomboid family serine protease
MRLVRDVDSQLAAEDLVCAFDDHGVVAQAIETRGQWGVWITDEAQGPDARALVERWFDAGAADELAAAVRRGRIRREVRVRVAERAELHQASLKAQVRALRQHSSTPLTWGLITLAVAVAALTQLTIVGSFPYVDLREQRDFVAMTSALMMADPLHFIAATKVQVLGHELTWLALPWQQPWRFITPVLLHFGVLHILFNALWLKDLGRLVEMVHGTRYLAAFVVVSGALSNIAQFEITGSPLFGGLSGVVYGLLGLIWLSGKLRPGLGYGLAPHTVQLMLLWLALGFIGNFGVANYCHLGGLLVGLLWAYTASFFARTR